MIILHLQLLFNDASVEWELNLFSKGNIDLCSDIFFIKGQKRQSQLPYRNLNILYQVPYQPNL